MRERCRFSGGLKRSSRWKLFGATRRLQEIASKHPVHPNQVSAWKRQAIEGLGEVFSNGIERRWPDARGLA